MSEWFSGFALGVVVGCLFWRCVATRTWKRLAIEGAELLREIRDRQIEEKRIQWEQKERKRKQAFRKRKPAR